MTETPVVVTKAPITRHPSGIKEAANMKTAPKRLRSSGFCPRTENSCWNWVPVPTKYATLYRL